MMYNFRNKNLWVRVSVNGKKVKFLYYLHTKIQIIDNCQFLQGGFNAYMYTVLIFLICFNNYDITRTVETINFKVMVLKNLANTGKF